MADRDTDATLEDSEGEEIELDEEKLIKLRAIAELGHVKDSQGRRKGIIPGTMPVIRTG